MADDCFAVVVLVAVVVVLVAIVNVIVWWKFHWIKLRFRTCLALFLRPYFKTERKK